MPQVMASYMSRPPLPSAVVVRQCLYFFVAKLEVVCLDRIHNRRCHSAQVVALEEVELGQDTALVAGATDKQLASDRFQRTQLFGKYVISFELLSEDGVDRHSFDNVAYDVSLVLARFQALYDTRTLSAECEFELETAGFGSQGFYPLLALVKRDHGNPAGVGAGVVNGVEAGYYLDR